MTYERWTDESLDRFASTITTAIAANVELIAANAVAIAAGNERINRIDERLEHFIHSADDQMDELRVVTQAIGRDLAQLVATQQAGQKVAEQERAELRQATLGIANLLSSLDSDRKRDLE
jgi:hypothetical protein